MVRKNIRDKLEVSEKQVQSIIREANQEIEGLQEKVNGKMNFYLQMSFLYMISILICKKQITQHLQITKL